MVQHLDNCLKLEWLSLVWGMGGWVSGQVSGWVVGVSHQIGVQGGELNCVVALAAPTSP